MYTYRGQYVQQQYLVFSLCLLDDVLLRPSGARFPLSSNGETFGGFSGKSWRLRRSLDLFCFCCSNSHWVCNGRRACDLRMDELSTRFTVLCPILKNYIKYRTSQCYEFAFSSVYILTYVSQFLKKEKLVVSINLLICSSRYISWCNEARKNLNFAKVLQVHLLWIPYVVQWH